MISGNGLGNGETNLFFTPPGEGANRYFLEESAIDIDSCNSHVALLCNEVSEGSSVLDIGCAQGKFGKALKEKGCTLFGIEMDEEAAAYARTSGCYAQVFVFDILDEHGGEDQGFQETVQQVDVIILSDILEHLSDPTKVLLKALTYLKTGGIVLVSVPNVAHADIYLNLINGRFNYAKMGILDNTHMKFFTRMSFLGWIKQINDVYPSNAVDCTFLGAVFHYNEYLNTVRAQYTELFRILECNPEFNAIQLLFKITKLSAGEEASDLMNALNIRKVDVVRKLGLALKGLYSQDEGQVASMFRSERMWYETTLDQLKKESQELLIDRFKKNERVEALLLYVADLEKMVGEKNDNVSQKETILSQALEANEKLRQDIAYQKNAITIKDNQIKEALDYITRMEKDAGEKFILISSRENQISEALRYIKELEGDTGSKAAQITEALGYIAELEKENASKSGHIDESLGKIASLESQLSERSNELSEAKAESLKYKQEVRQLKDTLFDIQESRAWKVAKSLTFWRK